MRQAIFLKGVPLRYHMCTMMTICGDFIRAVQTHKFSENVAEEEVAKAQERLQRGSST